MSVKVLGVHIRNSKNIGDKNCHPLDYFKVAKDQTSEDFRELPEGLKPDVVIVGGGAIAYTAPAIKKAYPKSVLVGWGIGHSERKLETVDSQKHRELGNGYSLWGARDYLAGLDHVPCASCMHSFFDDIPEAKHKVVVFGHAGVNPLGEESSSLGVPYFDNTHKGGLKAALEHIASGETVISSSYHGALWGLLMGRKVAMIPFGTKFFSMKYVPPAVKSVSEGISEARAFKHALAEYRELNIGFADRIRKIISLG